MCRGKSRAEAAYLNYVTDHVAKNELSWLYERMRLSKTDPHNKCAAACYRLAKLETEQAVPTARRGEPAIPWEQTPAPHSDAMTSIGAAVDR
jgi:hypothetical protein